MTEFKKTQLIDAAISKNLTPDNAYWKRLDFPVTIKHYGFINGLDFSPVEPYKFSVAYSAKVDIYDPASNRPCASLTRFKKGAYGGCFRRDGKLILVGGEDGRVKLFSVDSKLMLRLFKGHQSAVHCAKFMADCQFLSSFSDDKTVKLWDMATEKELRSLEGHKDYVRCGAVSCQNNDIVISGSYDHTVKVWDLRQDSSEAPALSLDHGCPVEAILIFPNDSLIVSAGGTTVKIWDVATGGKQLVQLSNHRKTISSLAFCSNNRRMLSGSLDRHVKVYDLATYQVVHTMDYPAPVVKIGISKDDNILAVAMTDCLLSIQHRLPEKSQEPKPKFSKNMSRRYLIKPSLYCEEPDMLIKEEIKNRLPRYDHLLRSFQHKRALDVVIRNHYFNVRYPEVVVSLLKEMIRRQALEKSLSNRTDDSLCLIVKFVTKNIGKAPFTPVLIDTANVLLDLYGDNLISLQPKTLEAFKRLKAAINQEASQLRQMTSLMGALQLIMHSLTDADIESVAIKDSKIAELSVDQSTSAAENSAELLCRLLSGENEIDCNKNDELFEQCAVKQMERSFSATLSSVEKKRRKTDNE